MRKSLFLKLSSFNLSVYSFSNIYKVSEAIYTQITERLSRKKKSSDLR